MRLPADKLSLSGPCIVLSELGGLCWLSLAFSFFYHDAHFNDDASDNKLWVVLFD